MAEKIISLGQKEFITGVSSNYQLSNSGVFYSADGINVFGDILDLSREVGLLMPDASPTNRGGATVVDDPMAGSVQVTSGGNSWLHFIGNTGHFYKFTVQGGAISDLRSGTPITNAACGTVIYQPQGGTEYLYYWQKTQIGRWDLSGTYPTGWVDNHFTGLQNTAVHPAHSFQGDVYYGNLDRIGKIYDNAGTAANNTNVLDFPSNFITAALGDDGTYLIAVITKNTGATATLADTRIIFWDTFSPSWNREFRIPDFIQCIKKKGNLIYGVGTQNLYVFNFDLPPIAIRRVGQQAAEFWPEAIEILNDAVLFGSHIPSIESYGSIVPEAPVSYHVPYSGLTGFPTMIKLLETDKLLVGTDGSKFYEYGLSDPTGGSATFTTIAFDLEDTYQIYSVVLTFYPELTSGESVAITLEDPTTSVAWGTASFAVHGAVDKVRLYSTNTMTTNSLSIIGAITGGGPGIKKIEVYGERVTEE